MGKLLLMLVFVFIPINFFSQTKVGGQVLDSQNQPVSYATISFKNSSEGVIADENGKFYLESKKTYNVLVVSFVGFKSKEISLSNDVNYKLNIVLETENQIKEVKVYSGKTSKKDNPAIRILKKIWARKMKNGLNMFKYYQYNKYEKIEFDLNSIDSSFKKKKLFKGLEFIFKNVDTSAITGKNYLPVFINENLSSVYGDNVKKRYKDKLIANKYSGFNNANNDGVNSFLKDLYVDYNIYDNYLKFFDKDFTSPLSTTGIDVYNYVLSDSTFIDKKWCYNIVYYPRRKSELTFKGDFWVNDSTFAIKSINLQASRSANINWIRDFYLEQEFDVVNDSVFLPKRDYFMSDFAFSKKENRSGMYGKRTTMYKDYKFNQLPKDEVFEEEPNLFDKEKFRKSDDFWEENRFESLNNNEKGIYKMLDTLKKVPKFKTYYNFVAILGSGYVNFGKIDYGPVLSTFGYNDVQGLRIQGGFRTYFSPNDRWRIQGYTAYGFKDTKLRFGIVGKYMISPKNRFIITVGLRDDVEQAGASLTTTNDIIGRTFATSALVGTGINNKLTNIFIKNIGMEIEPIKNLIFSANFTNRYLSSANRDFKIDYFTDASRTQTASNVTQSEINFVTDWHYKRKVVGYGVDRVLVDKNYARVFLSYSHGFKGVFNSDFKYDKIQFYYRQPILIGGLGRLFTTFEAGKIFGKLPLSLLSVVPGNQSYFVIENTYSLLNFYDFITDQYASLHLEHNFNGRLFARVPWLRALNWREIIGLKTVFGSISQENIALNATGTNYLAPTKGYIEYHVGVGNIFKVMKVDFSWRGSYFGLPNARRFGVNIGFGFHF